MKTPERLFCFGLGFVGSTLAREIKKRHWKVAGTCRETDHIERLRQQGIQVVVFNGDPPSQAVTDALQKSSHVLVTIPPQKSGGDVVLKNFERVLVEGSHLKWVGYLSTTGVYGNRNGDWVDERSEVRPEWAHQKRRAAVESQWLALHREHGIPVHIFRLAGIYGPGRNLLQRVRQGAVRRIDCPGLVFNRVHVDDVVQVLTASMADPHPGTIYNVSDDRPASPLEAVEFACRLLQVPAPPLVSLDDAGLSEMARSFYLTHKRVRNSKIKEELGVTLRYPDYQSGLRSLLEEFPEE